MPAIIHSASTYLAAANQAVRYVKSTLPLGSTNNPSDFIRYPAGGTLRWGESAVGQAVAAQQSVADLRKLAPMDRSDPRFNLTLIETWARNATAVGAGNCALQAAVAFVYLRGQRVFPLEFMRLSGDRDHGFVILGRDASTDLNNFAEWTGGSSILCDPWRGTSGVAGMLAVWYGTTGVELLTRLEE
jgi:hypothetical protein